MFAKLKMLMADGNEQDFEFVSNGMTQYRYRQLTGRDLTKDATKLINDNAGVADDADFSVSDKLAYIMNMSAVKADMSKINIDSFYEWIEQFDSSNSINIMGDIIGIYFGTKKSTSEPKKGDGE